MKIFFYILSLFITISISIYIIYLKVIIKRKTFKKNNVKVSKTNMKNNNGTIIIGNKNKNE